VFKILDGLDGSSQTLPGVVHSASSEICASPPRVEDFESRMEMRHADPEFVDVLDGIARTTAARVVLL
jgi:hypothetical protein